MTQTADKIYTVRADDYAICLPENGDSMTYEKAKLAAMTLRARGYRGVYIRDQTSGEVVS